MHKQPHDQELSELLHEWKLERSLPPRFAEQVWQRIAQPEERRGIILWRLFSRSLERIFARPSFAISYVAILLATALGMGLWQAHGKASAESRERYVQMVDPFQMPRH